MSEEQDYSRDLIDTFKERYEIDDDNAAMEEARRRFLTVMTPDERKAFTLNLKDWAECEENIGLRERGIRHKLHCMFAATGANLKRFGR
jgi:hypothetical protein